MKHSGKTNSCRTDYYLVCYSLNSNSGRIPRPDLLGLRGASVINGTYLKNRDGDHLRGHVQDTGIRTEVNTRFCGKNTDEKIVVVDEEVGLWRDGYWYKIKFLVSGAKNYRCLPLR